MDGTPNGSRGATIPVRTKPYFSGSRRQDPGRGVGKIRFVLIVRALTRYGLVPHALLERRDPALDGRGRNGVGGRQVEPAGARAPLEVAVDRRHGDLLGGVRHARSAPDTGAAARGDHLDAGCPEDLQVALLGGIALHVLAAELDVEAHPVRHAPTGVAGLPHDRGVHVEVILLAGRARPAVRDVDRHRAQIGDEGAVGGVGGNASVGVARIGHHRRDGRQVDPVDATVVHRADVGSDAPGAERRHVGPRPLGLDPGQGRLVGFDDAGTGTALRRHVGEGRALVHGQGGAARGRRTP